MTIARLLPLYDTRKSPISFMCHTLAHSSPFSGSPAAPVPSQGGRSSQGLHHHRQRLIWNIQLHAYAKSAADCTETLQQQEPSRRASGTLVFIHLGIRIPTLAPKLPHTRKHKDKHTHATVETPSLGRQVRSRRGHCGAIGQTQGPRKCIKCDARADRRSSPAPRTVSSLPRAASAPNHCAPATELLNLVSLSLPAPPSLRGKVESLDGMYGLV